jgi:Na+/melibiose symporter-like transporter
MAEKSVRVRLLANRNFRLLWLGENVSLLGDQFYLVALPWLVFQMTDSSLAFGALMMVAGIPRAMLMLVGGVLADRFSPRSVMMISNLLRLGITVFLTLLVASQVIQLWMLFVIAIGFGTVDAFFHPAYRAMMPLVDDHAAVELLEGAVVAAPGHEQPRRVGAAVDGGHRRGHVGAPSCAATHRPTGSSPPARCQA